jgi:hypothetical protein
MYKWISEGRCESGDEVVAIKRYGHISTWSAGAVTDMSCLFQDCKVFNEAIGHWDVSKVRSMAGMFQNAAAFDQPLTYWDVGKVMNMSKMFFPSSSFQPVFE